MNIGRGALIAGLLAVTVAVTAAPAHAAPQSVASPVTYRAEVVDNNQVAATLDGGEFVLAADRSVVEVRDNGGQLIDTVPLRFTLAGRELPILGQISADGAALRLTPQTAGFDRSALTAVASPVENQLAMNDLINAVSIGTSIGSLIGTAIGATLGIGIGAVVAAGTCTLLLSCVVTALPIVALTGAVGGLAGAVIAGGPTAAVSVYEYVQTLNAAPGQSKFAPVGNGR